MEKWMPMGKVEDLYYLTPDGAKIRFRHYLNKSSRWDIVILPGRASFIEKFQDVIEYLRQTGYNVWIFDWRGQGLSTRFTKKAVISIPMKPTFKISKDLWKIMSNLFGHPSCLWPIYGCPYWIEVSIAEILSLF